jgi:DNA-binding CsgD family transcriptional regulator
LQYYVSKYYGRELLPFGNDLSDILGMENFDSDTSTGEGFNSEVHSKVREDYLRQIQPIDDFEERLLVYETSKAVLNQREYEIFRMIMSGVSLKEIANYYQLNPSRISHIKKQVIKKLRYAILEKEMQSNWESELIGLLDEIEIELGEAVWLARTKNGSIVLQSESGILTKFGGISLEEAVVKLRNIIDGITF